jgi:hypothetical protein
MITPGKLELTIKITTLPVHVATDPNGWKVFNLDCDGVRVAVRLRPKMWIKLEQAASSLPVWVAAIAGKMGERTAEGFALEESAVQVFERKAAKPPAT